jgi:UDP-N-acetylmuramate--alanine ligase
MRPANRLRVVFQPHRYARLAKYLNEFARELREGADEVLVTPVFAAWSESGQVDSADLARLVGAKAALCSSDWSAVASAILADASDQPTTLAVLGAGDVDGLVSELAEKRSGEQPSSPKATPGQGRG